VKKVLPDLFWIFSKKIFSKDFSVQKEMKKRFLQKILSRKQKRFFFIEEVFEKFLLKFHFENLSFSSAII